MAVYMLGLRLGLGLVLALFSALLGPAHFAMICSGHGHLCLTGCRNSAPSTQSTPWRRHSLGTRRKRTHADDVAQVADVGALGGDEFVDDVTDVRAVSTAAGRRLDILRVIAHTIRRAYQHRHMRHTETCVHTHTPLTALCLGLPRWRVAR